MAFDFSITQDRLTPIRPQKIERLFNSPSGIITPSKIINDITYQVNVDKQSQLQQTAASNYNYFDNTIGLDHVDRNLLRQSTCLKGDKPLLDKTNSSPQASKTVASDLLRDSIDSNNYDAIPQYKPFYQVTDSHPIRATCFHPGGDVFVVGTNSKSMKIYMYPTEEELQNLSSYDDETIQQPRLAFQFLHIHRGSVYCTAFNQNGTLIASGSNDQTIHVIKYNSCKHQPGAQEMLFKHSGTVRDLCFINDGTENNSSSLLVTAGAGEFELNVFDCEAVKRVHKFQGHESTVMSLHQWNDSPTFVSGSLDGTIRIWDLRGKRCTSIISTNRPGGDQGGGPATPVGATRIEPTGKLLVSGHVDGRCMLYDIRGGKVVQLFKAHDNEIRTLNFSPKSYYLLTAGYDHKVKLMDLQGDLTRKLPSVEIANLDGRIIQTAWHPRDYNFVTTSADGSATLWTMP